VVRCWGAGYEGRLGNGAVTNLMDEPAEQASTVPLGLPAVAISAGNAHTCALLTDGTVRCWGAGYGGRLGHGAETHLMDESGEAASTVALGATAVSVDAGSGSTCAVTSTGKVRCWGTEQFGELGDGTASGALMDEPGETPSTVPLG
jgi:alpha-tubulin suppressor-like RCC1 family protein